MPTDKIEASFMPGCTPWSTEVLYALEKAIIDGKGGRLELSEDVLHAQDPSPHDFRRLNALDVHICLVPGTGIFAELRTGQQG